MSDVLITPASKKIEFKDSSSNVDGKIELDGNDNLVLTSANDLVLGDGSTDLHIGDGTNSIDLVYDQSGRIYGAANKDITIGKSSVGGNDIIVDSPNWSIDASGNATFSGGTSSLGSTNNRFVTDDSNNQLHMKVNGSNRLTVYNNGNTTITGTITSTNGSVYLNEKASAGGDSTAYGQLWVKTATPNELYFTTDAGNDIQLTSGTSAAGGGGSVSAVANGANNRIATFSSADALNGEANLTFDGSTLSVTGAVSATSNDGSVPTGLFYRNDSSTTAPLMKLVEDSVYADNPTLEVITDRTDGAIPSISVSGGAVTVSGPNGWNTWEKETFYKRNYGTASGQNSGLVNLSHDEVGTVNSFTLPYDAKLRAVAITYVFTSSSSSAVDQTWRLFHSGDPANVVSNFTFDVANDMTNMHGNFYLYVSSGLDVTMNKNKTYHVRRESGTLDIQSTVRFDLWYTRHTGNF